LAFICLASAVFSGHKESEIIPGQYIFQFLPTASLESKTDFLKSFSLIPGNKIRFEWQILDFHAFSAETTENYVSSVNRDIFKYIENDATVHLLDEEVHPTACTTQNEATWGIDRVSERAILLDGQYQYEFDGTGVDSYIIDTGILITHNEFASGRATFGSNWVGDGNNNDCHGHGTHVAGTVGGTVYGVAKKVSLVAVKVLGCSGGGTWEGVISGINWVVQQHQARGRPSTANMSLGGGRNQPCNDATDAAVRAGVVMAVAGGNSNADACTFSPASAPLAITVGATDVSDNGGVQQDIRSSFSNWGRCTDTFAPGTMITSAWIGSNTAIRTISGTSMASPHVCGVASLVRQKNPTWNPTQVEDWLHSDSTKGVINLNCAGRAGCLESPNRMIYSACDV
jgi:subtilisin family serine protease